MLGGVLLRDGAGLGLGAGVIGDVGAGGGVVEAEGGGGGAVEGDALEGEGLGSHRPVEVVVGRVPVGLDDALAREPSLAEGLRVGAVGGGEEPAIFVAPFVPAQHVGMVGVEVEVVDPLLGQVLHLPGSGEFVLDHLLGVPSGAKSGLVGLEVGLAHGLALLIRGEDADEEERLVVERGGLGIEEFAIAMEKLRDARDGLLVGGEVGEGGWKHDAGVVEVMVFDMRPVRVLGRVALDIVEDEAWGGSGIRVAECEGFAVKGDFDDLQPGYGWRNRRVHLAPDVDLAVVGGEAVRGALVQDGDHVGLKAKLLDGLVGREAESLRFVPFKGDGLELLGDAGEGGGEVGRESGIGGR